VLISLITQLEHQLTVAGLILSVAAEVHAGGRSVPSSPPKRR
jgi:hypothetical protein